MSTPRNSEKWRNAFDNIIQKYFYHNVIIVNGYDVRISNLVTMASLFEVNPDLLEKTIVAACVRMSNVFSIEPLNISDEISVIKKVTKKIKIINLMETNLKPIDQTSMAFY